MSRKSRNRMMAGRAVAPPNAAPRGRVIHDGGPPTPDTTAIVSTFRPADLAALSRPQLAGGESDAREQRNPR